MSVRRRGRLEGDWEDERESRKDRRDEKPDDKRTSPSLIEDGGRTERTARWMVQDPPNRKSAS